MRLLCNPDNISTNTDFIFRDLIAVNQIVKIAVGTSLVLRKRETHTKFALCVMRGESRQTTHKKVLANAVYFYKERSLYFLETNLEDYFYTVSEESILFIRTKPLKVRTI